VYLRIQLVNPCDILTKEVLHADIASNARERCKKMYKEYFLNEIEKMCPTGSHDHTLIKQKRFVISLLIGILVVSVTASVGLGVAGVTMASVNSGKIDDLQTALKKQEEETIKLDQKIELLENAVRLIENNVDKLAEKMDTHEEDHSELKWKQVGSTYAISYVTARLIIVQHIIREATRKWKERKVHASLLDFFNVTLPCGDDCPISLATAEACHMSYDKNDLFIDFSVPVINRTMELIEADPFDIMLKQKNQTCHVKYTGPRHMIVSTVNGCAVAANLKIPVAQDLILSPSHGCMPQSEIPTETKYFTVERCDLQHPNDEYSYVQIKPFHGSNHVYCPGSTLEIFGKNESCPEEVFLLPMTASFRINGMEYKGSQVHLDHQEKVDPLFTMKTNWQLQPRLNFTDLRNHPLLSPFRDVQSYSQSQTTQLLMWTVVALGLIIVTLIVLLSICYFRNRRIKVSVVANPEEGQVIELENRD
jgi:hypothetical protein